MTEGGPGWGRRALQALGLLALFPLGYGAGWLTWVLAVPPVDGSAPVVDTVQHRTAPDPRPAPPAPEDTSEELLSACQSELEACQALARMQRTQAIGAPRPWTDQVPPAHRPPAVREAVAAVEEQCGVERTFVDCDEHPCLVYVPVGASLGDCPAWPYDVPFSGGASPDPDDVDLRIHYVLEPGDAHPLGDPGWRPRLEHRLESNRARVEDHFAGEGPR